MNIEDLKASAEREEIGVPVELYGQDAELIRAADGTAATITVVGPFANRIHEERNAQTRRALRERRSQTTPAELHANRIALVAAGVVAWHGWESNGEPWPCTPENVRTLLATEFILKQVEDAIGRHGQLLASGAP